MTHYHLKKVYLSMEAITQKKDYPILRRLDKASRHKPAE